MQGINIIEAKLDHTTIHYSETTEQLKQWINNGQIINLKSCFSIDQLITLKNSIHRWGQQYSVFVRGQSASIPNINFHRIDESNLPTKVPHCFHQYGLGNLNILNEELRWLLYQVANPLLTLQNAIAGTNYKFSDQKIRIKFLHYPCGGGYLAKHIHPLEPQRVGLIVSLSEWSNDFSEGGNLFYTPNNGCINTSPHHSIGDVLLFRYDIPHEIQPIDPQQNINWESLSGKWSLVLELLQTNADSNAVSGDN